MCFFLLFLLELPQCCSRLDKDAYVGDGCSGCRHLCLRGRNTCYALAPLRSKRHWERQSTRAEN